MAEKLAEAMARVRESAPLRQWCEQNLHPIGTGFECPNCHSGTGPKHTPAFALNSDGVHWKCWSCQKRGDIFDLAGILYQTEDKAEQVNHVAAWAGVDGWGEQSRVETYGWAESVAADNWEPTEKAAEPTKRAVEGMYESKVEEHRAYIKMAQAHIEDPEAVAYLASRGIDLDTARAWR